jgi:hypothetical protein
VSRQLTIPTADTQLYAGDSQGGSPPLLFLSGGFGTVAELGVRYPAPPREVPHDPVRRAGAGKSVTSAGYSMQGAVDDVGHVIEATPVLRIVGKTRPMKCRVSASQTRHPPLPDSDTSASASANFGAPALDDVQHQ